MAFAEAVRSANSLGDRSWPRSGGAISRYYVLIEIDGNNLAEILVGEGLARVEGVGHVLPSAEKSSAYVDRLTVLEQEARDKRLGAWSTTVEEKKSSD
jgi:endonuclease YncB( thermonuclease family)